MRQSRVSTGNPRQRPFFALFRMLPNSRGPHPCAFSAQGWDSTKVKVLGFCVILETLFRRET